MAKYVIEEMVEKHGYLPGDALLGDMLGVSRSTITRIRDNGLSEQYDQEPVRDRGLIVAHLLFRKEEPKPLTLVERIKQRLTKLPQEDLAAIDELLQEATKNE